MDYQKYFDMPNAEVPKEIAAVLTDGGHITKTLFEDKNEILTNPELKYEAGYAAMPGGNWLVSMYCPMPGVTREMVDWWFWWHARFPERYRLWYPGEHFGISYGRFNEDYFQRDEFPGFQPNTHYPIERIGKAKLELCIRFRSPEEFGFSRQAMEDAKVGTIVCGHVGVMKGLVEHTEMTHIFFETDDGLFLASRFWMGNRFKTGLVRHFAMNEETARAMATHCCVEYRNFAVKIPMLYREYLEELGEKKEETP